MSSMSCLLRSLDKVAKEIRLIKLGVRVGGLSWLILSAASKKRDGKRSRTIATNFKNLDRTEGVVVMEVLSREVVVRLEGAALTWEVSSGVTLMVLGGDISMVG